MHKITNFTGQARQGLAQHASAMGFGGSRPHPLHDLSIHPPNAKRSLTGSSNSPNHVLPGQTTNLSFNVPLNPNTPGPEKEDVLYSSPNAFQKWTHPDGAAEDHSSHALPIHTRNVEAVRVLCRQISENSGGMIETSVTSSKPKAIPGMPRVLQPALVTNVCISGETEMVHKMRSRILMESPITLRCDGFDIDREIVFPKGQDGAREDILEHMDEIAAMTKADIFLLEPKSKRKDSDSISGLEKSMENKLHIQIYGDVEGAENAKTRLLIMVDKLLNRVVDSIRLELSLHNLIAGRQRRNIQGIQSATGTAIYFPPLFPTVFGNAAHGSIPLRERDEIIITGNTIEQILHAKQLLHDLVMNTKNFVKDVQITANKVDYILLERLDKVRKIIEANGSHVLVPPLGNQGGMLRVQATDILNVERTIREIMSLAGHFYYASWWVTSPDPSARQPTPAEVRRMLPDISISSGADISFENLTFHITGSDDAVKGAMWMINQLPFVKRSQSTLGVKVELANEHKEFVSGKKNGKINKIMSQSNVQIVFDGFNEYNFYIDVRGQQYEATQKGLGLVEQEMPAAISFHVPDQYHKRIIGIGGQHIQRIMKKYSVFVKFSNAMDRGMGTGKEQEDDIKVDNVICRTPARNAYNLELVKQEIMDMVEKGDAEFVSQEVPIDRLYHRELIQRMHEIDELEKTWNCKITFPGAEHASDMITITGPQYQVPLAVDGFLGMIPAKHEIEFPSSEDLRKYLTSDDFRIQQTTKLKEQQDVDVAVEEPRMEKQGDTEVMMEKITLRFTKNNTGGLDDAIGLLLLPLIARGLDSSSVKGSMARPKSDSFTDNLKHFGGKILQPAEPDISTDSPTNGTFPDDASNSSIFKKFQLPKQNAFKQNAFSSFLANRRKTGSASPASLAMHASNNASKASLISIESRESSYTRKTLNDSGVELEQDGPGHHSNHGNGWQSFGSSGTTRPSTASNSLSGFSFGNGNASSTSLNTPMIPGLGMISGDMTPKYDPQARTADGGSLSSAMGAPPRPASANAATTLSAAANGRANTPAATASPIAAPPTCSTTPSIKTPPATASTTNASTTTAPPSSGYPAPIGPPR